MDFFSALRVKLWFYSGKEGNSSALPINLYPAALRVKLSFERKKLRGLTVPQTAGLIVFLGLLLPPFPGCMYCVVDVKTNGFYGLGTAPVTIWPLVVKMRLVNLRQL